MTKLLKYILEDIMLRNLFEQEQEDYIMHMLKEHGRIESCYDYREKYGFSIEEQIEAYRMLQSACTLEYSGIKTTLSSFNGDKSLLNVEERCLLDTIEGTLREKFLYTSEYVEGPAFPSDSYWPEAINYSPPVI